MNQLDLCMVSYVSASHTVDAHTQAASQLYGVEYDAVTPTQRELAKNRNFARAYGGKCFGGKTVDCRNFVTQAETIRLAQHRCEHYPWVRAFLDRFCVRV
jgi:DNA polymerase I-like protein with 3'-5' exonuclease and polymerase domains